MSNPILEAKNLTKTYRSGKLETPVLKGIDFSIYSKETIAIVGNSGSGKSTLLHCLGTLDTPTSGAIRLAGVDPFSLTEDNRGRLRGRYIGFVYQFHHLLPEFTAQENVAMPLLIRREPQKSAMRKAAAMLDQVGLGHRLAYKPSELSGGERQRAAVARALVMQPACLLADEPTGNLDIQTAQDIFNLIIELSIVGDTAVVIVTHDTQLALRCDRCLNLVDGQIEHR